MKTNCKNLGYPLGYVFSLYVICVLFIYPFILWKYGWIGFLFGNLLRFSTFIIDMFTSNATEYNMSIMEKNGYDSKKLLRKGIFGFFVGSTMFAALYIPAFEGAEARFDTALIFNVFVTLVITEIYFTVSHKAMHRYFPDLHKIHHFCVKSSVTSNILLGEVDVFVEFNAPALIVYFINVYWFNDYFSFILSVAFVSCWYFVDHDEYLKLPHYYHHQYINSNYSVYIKSGEFDEKDEMKKIIFR
jgi:hypothetical protein